MCLPRLSIDLLCVAWQMWISIPGLDFALDTPDNPEYDDPKLKHPACQPRPSVKWLMAEAGGGAEVARYGGALGLEAKARSDILNAYPVILTIPYRAGRACRACMGDRCHARSSVWGS